MFRGHLEAYLVLRMKMYADRGRAVELVDLEGETDKSVVHLLDITRRLGKLGPLTVWEPTMSEARQDALRRLGFEERADAPRSITENYATILVRPTAPDISKRPWLLAGRDLLDLASWDLRQIYSHGS